MSLDTISNATFTQDQVMRMLIEPLRNQSTYLRQGFPTFTSNGEPIKVPSLTTIGTATFTTQGSAIAEATASTSEVELLPSTVWYVKRILRMSNEVVRQAVIGVQSAFSTALVNDVAEVLDKALWAGGTATSGSPIGMLNFTGSTNAGTVAGTALASGNLYDVEEYALVNKLEADALAWGISPKNFTRIRKMTDNYGARVLQPSLAAGAPGTLLRHPYTVTNHVPDTAIPL
jgi:HK97 family phage major capsid protein